MRLILFYIVLAFFLVFPFNLFAQTKLSPGECGPSEGLNAAMASTLYGNKEIASQGLYTFNIGRSEVLVVVTFFVGENGDWYEIHTSLARPERSCIIKEGTDWIMQSQGDVTSHQNFRLHKELATLPLPHHHLSSVAKINLSHLVRIF